MKIYRFYLLALIALAIGVSACNEDDERDPLSIPAAYDGSSFNTNATTELGVRASLTSLVNEMKKGRTPGAILTYNTLNQFYALNGNPTLLSITTPYYSERINNTTNGFLLEMANASGFGYTPGSPVGQGGTYGGYLFDENGLEMEQMVEKGLFGAMLFNHFNQLAEGDITAQEVDGMVAIFGAHPDFPNSYQANLHANPDVFAANYAARRDKNDGQGYYTRIRDNFIKLQAAVRAGAEYNQERDDAVAEIRLNWEKANAATVINYLHSVISKLSATSPSDADKASALHSYGEAVGFMHGFRTVDHKTISDAEIEEMLTLLNAPYNGTPTSYTFVTDAVNQLPKLTQAINRLADIYDFSAAEVEDFKQNWVDVQKR